MVNCRSFIETAQKACIGDTFSSHNLFANQCWRATVSKLRLIVPFLFHSSIDKLSNFIYLFFGSISGSDSLRHVWMHSKVEKKRCKSTKQWWVGCIPLGNCFSRLWSTVMGWTTHHPLHVSLPKNKISCESTCPSCCFHFSLLIKPKNDHFSVEFSSFKAPNPRLHR